MKTLIRFFAVGLILLLASCAPQATEKSGGDDAADNHRLHDFGAAALTPGRDGPVFPKSSMPEHLIVYDTQSDSFEMKLLLASLQGIVAKTQPRIYLLMSPWTNPDTDNHEQFWLDEMISKYGVTSETANDPWALVDVFAGEIDGVIVYDADLPETINLATTLAGINKSIVVAPSLLAEAQAHGLAVTQDLRGQFTDVPSMYEWALANVWPLANQGILCFLKRDLPTLRDYLVRNDVFTLMLDPHVPEERVVLERVLSDTTPNIPILGWAVDELLGVIIFSEHTKFHIASDFNTNLSVHSGLPAPTLSQDHAGEFGEVENKLYISFGLTDGDSVTYATRTMLTRWNDGARGQVPLGWEVSSNLIDLAPEVIGYFYETKTENDMFIGPACGVGYIYPGRYPDLPAFLALTKPYLEAADMDTIWLINDDLTLPDDVVRQYTSALSLSGIFIDYWPNLDKGFYFASDGTPVLRSQYVYLIGPEQIPTIIAEKKIEKDYFFADCPFFLFIGVNAWTTTPTYIKGIADGLSEDYEVLRPDAMFAAMRKVADLAECVY